MTARPVRACSIENVGKQRNGKFRFWCSAHKANATGRYGARLPVCEGAYLDTKDRNIIEIDPAEYPGGIALWGAVAPAYDTTDLPAESGIHVHARGRNDGDKQIDNTFDAVMIRYKRDLLREQKTVITSEVAVNYYLSRFVGQEIRFLRCPYCDEIHLDSGYFAVKPHRRHLCHGCGRYFTDDRRAVSNPIAALHAEGLLPAESKPPVRPDRVLNIRQSDYPGGIQIWASNPALVWTADRAEEAGLHVHVFHSAEKIAFDETYSSVVIDGIEIDEEQVQYLMAQGALPHLAGKVVGLRCPKCATPHFDRGQKAFEPHVEHECSSCHHVFIAPGRRRLVVSNPFVETQTNLMPASIAGRIASTGESL